jgi:hypothetical protein
MRKLFLLCLLLLTQVWADSPLTSTTFWEAYQDVPEVAKANDLRRLNSELGRFLLSSAPLDQKAALINALSWNVELQQNAPLFQEQLAQKYKCSESEVGAKLSPSEAFCMGYLVALDDYNHPNGSLSYLKKARKAYPASYTVAVVESLVVAQMNFKDFKKMWVITNQVFQNKELKADMRPKGRKIIYDYMKLYEKY